MSLSQQFKTSPQKILMGIEITFAANPDGTLPTFVISRSGKANKAYAKELDRTFKPHQRALQLKTMPDELAGKLLREVFAKTCLLEWRNVLKSDVSGDKEAQGYMNFNVENALQLFENLPELFDELQAQANDASLFRDDVMENNAKN